MSRVTLRSHTSVTDPLEPQGPGAMSGALRSRDRKSCAPCVRPFPLTRVRTDLLGPVPVYPFARLLPPTLPTLLLACCGPRVMCESWVEKGQGGKRE